jgi:1-acyl-sn-glycerol-3-phosphate acyltransferase
MKIGKFRSFWIAMLSILYTAQTTGLCVIKRMFGTNSRAWVDQELHRWVDRVLNIIGVKCKVVNPFNIQPVPGKATIIMCNHTSLYDIPLSFKSFPNHSIRMLAKKELASMPIMGQGMAAAEFPFIDRKNRLQAIKDLAAARKLMESGILMWIAPEGTRSRDGKLAPFKKGAFMTAIESKATIIPIGIIGAYEILPAKTMQLNINQSAEIRIGKPVDASKFTIAERQKLVDIVHQSIKELVESKEYPKES